jgi:hypothetical protein
MITPTLTQAQAQEAVELLAELKDAYLKLWNFVWDVSWINYPSVTEKHRAKILVITCDRAKKLLAELNTDDSANRRAQALLAAIESEASE